MKTEKFEVSKHEIQFRCEWAVYRKDSNSSECYCTSRERAEWIADKLNRSEDGPLVPNAPGWWWRKTKSKKFWFPVWANARCYQDYREWSKTVDDGLWGGRCHEPGFKPEGAR